MEAHQALHNSEWEREEQKGCFSCPPVWKQMSIRLDFRYNNAFVLLYSFSQAEFAKSFISINELNGTGDIVDRHGQVTYTIQHGSQAPSLPQGMY